MNDQPYRWVAEGTGGRVMCEDCSIDPGSETCFGCPKAWRTRNGQTEYYKEPIHGLPEEM
jgi:hypothetical protein